MQRRGSFLKLTEGNEPSKYIKFFDEVSLKDISQVGGKNASLGEMYQHLREHNVRVPYGFAVTISGYEVFIEHNHLGPQIAQLMSTLKPDDLESLSQVGSQIRQLIAGGDYPSELESEITQAYKLLCDYYVVKHVDVAVRSSSLSEDSVTSSYAGQQDTYLNVSQLDNVLLYIKMCYASLYTDRAISYCASIETKDPTQKNMSETRKMGICVQKMVRSDLGASGVAMTVDTESGFHNAIIINGSLGLGEFVVGGEVDPDEFCIFKPTGAIIDKKLGSKLKKLVYADTTDTNKDNTKEVETTTKERNTFCLDERQVRKLGRWAIDIENHYAKIAGVTSRPMDIEWAFDGQSEELYIVQARPVTTLKASGQIHEFHLKADQKLESLITGTAVGDRIATGTVRIITSVTDPAQVKSFQKGDILVADVTSPDFEPIMALASAIVTNRGGRTCHAAIIAREQGIPAIVGCGTAIEILQVGNKVTVCCSQGEIGNVYKGELNYDQISIDLSQIQKPEEPKVMFNLASPDIAFKTSMLPHAGVGLLRMEFIISNFIKVHPLALINYSHQPDEIKAKIDELIKGYESPIEYYIQKLAYGVAKITAAFSPYEVILRFSDFKSNEYCNLLGGQFYEPIEENPMLGFRGASRYYSQEFEPAFLLECVAVKRIREEMGLDNLVVMIPFCRTPLELTRVTETMAKANLVRGVNGLKLYLMAELPSNFLRAEEFSALVDGFSIGSNDLTQTTLGLDRDSHLVAHIYNEEDESVKSLIRMIIAIAKKNKVKIGICGQGPSDRPTFVDFLMECGIDSISITPDSLFKVFNNINKTLVK
jgi:pyruvate,water dikinase